MTSDDRFDIFIHGLLPMHGKNLDYIQKPIYSELMQTKLLFGIA